MIETALRNAIRQIMPNGKWAQAKGAPDEAKLRRRQVEEGKRRDGVGTSADLLDYAETYELTDLIEKNWEPFSVIFDDSARTKTYFGIIKDVRNSVAHSRDLVTFERELLSGIAGQLRNQVALYRNQENPSAPYYPLIDSFRDSFGNQGVQMYAPPAVRLDVGSVVNFVATATAARGRSLTWSVSKMNPSTYQFEEQIESGGEGERLATQYTVTEDDVREEFLVCIALISDSKYHRHQRGVSLRAPVCDDFRTLTYAVNPPHDL